MRQDVFAEARFGPQLHLLDDGFQHRWLARDFDIVLVTPQDATDACFRLGACASRCIPCAARMRLCSPVAHRRSRFRWRDKIVWRVRRGIVPKNVPARPIVFCGIARPQNFVLQLRAANIEPVAEAFYRDHHAYSEKDIRELLN